MEQDSRKHSSLLFDEKIERFYKRLADKDINAFMYAFGINLHSYHHEHKNLNLITSYASVFKALWNVEIWSRVTWGADDIKTEDMYEKEFDEAMVKGQGYFDYLINQSIKYNRPDWCMFGLLGMMQGTLNRNQYEVADKESIFTQDGFLSNIKYLPESFLRKYKNDLESLFTYFDERNYKLIIDDLKGSSIKIV